MQWVIHPLQQIFSASIWPQLFFLWTKKKEKKKKKGKKKKQQKSGWEGLGMVIASYRPNHHCLYEHLATCTNNFLLFHRLSLDMGSTEGHLTWVQIEVSSEKQQNDTVFGVRYLYSHVIWQEKHVVIIRTTNTPNQTRCVERRCDIWLSIPTSQT